MSVTVTSTGLVWLGLTLLATLLVAAAIVFVQSRVRVGSIGDQLRSARFVVDYERALGWRGVGARERARLVSELRANLAAAAQDGGLPAAIGRLGSARDLASEITADLRNPTWRRGIVGAAVALVALQALTVAALDVWASAAEASGAARVDGGAGALPGLEFSYRADGPLSVESAGAWYWTLLIPVATFLVRSRIWRLWQRRTGVVERDA